MRVTWAWAMPSRSTFSIPPIAELLDRYVGGISVDPFCGESTRATFANDLASDEGMEASVWLDLLLQRGVRADVVLFDPPYSPRQIMEVYKSVGFAVGRRETQNARLYKAVRAKLHRLLRPGGIAISCGWNSNGFGLTLGYEKIELLVTAHGGAHNDTLTLVERKRVEQP